MFTGSKRFVCPKFIVDKRVAFGRFVSVVRLIFNSCRRLLSGIAIRKWEKLGPVWEVRLVWYGISRNCSLRSWVNWSTISLPY